MKIPLNDLNFFKLDDSFDISSFSCGNTEIDSFIKDDAKNYQKDRISVTYLCYYHDELVGFFSVAMGCIDARAVEPQDGKKGYGPKKYPALRLAQMATLKEYQGHDVGKNMLTYVFAIGFALCEFIGCRVVIVDAKKDEKTINFYKKYGSFEDFGPSDATTQSLLRDLNKIPDGERINTELTEYQKK